MSNRAAALRRVLAPVLLACLAAILLAPAGGARADDFGQLERWGSQGTDPGQFYFSTVFGVDSDDESVYVVDFTEGGEYRLQKLSSSGAPLASTTIPYADGLIGVAVDASSDRVYLLQHALGEGGAATNILVYSTTPDGSRRLVAPAGLPSGRLAAPGGAAALIEPAAITVDKSNGELLVLAEDASNHVVVQRIAADGTPGRRFVDDGDIPISVNSLTGFALASDGTVYISTGGFGTFTLYALTSSWDGAARVTEAATARTAERWSPGGAVAPFDLFGFSVGPQLAIGSDDTLYWAEEVLPDSSPTPGNYLIRGWSPETGRTKVVYGGSTSGACSLQRIAPALAAGRDDASVFVLDHAPGDPIPAPYGEHVSKFGAGGSGCPTPSAAFTINGRADAVVNVTKGETTTFLAAVSLNGATVSRVDWDLDGSGAFATSSGTALRLTHRFTRAGSYTVSLRVTVTGSVTGNPPIVTRRVSVAGTVPTAAFTATPRQVDAGGSVAFDASESFDPAGDLASYRWEFGDGATQVTTTPAVSHVYANPAADAITRTVKLTVRNSDGADSDAVSQTITVKGTPVTPPPPPPPPPPTTTTDPPPPPPAPVASRVAIRGVRATSAGVVGLTLSCPAGSSACNGTLALTTTVRVAARRGRRARTQTLALGSVSFALTAGGSRAVTVRLSAAGRRLLATSRKLKIALRATTRAGSSSATTTASATIALPRARRARRAKK